MHAARLAAAMACAARGRRHSSTVTTARQASTPIAIQPPMSGQDVAWKLSSCLLPIIGGW